MRLIVALALITMLSGCSDPEPTPVRGDPRATNYPLSRTTPDPGPAMNFDPGRPYVLKFGRGSGWEGLDTISVDEEGRVIRFRAKSGRTADGQPYVRESSRSQIDTAAAHQIGQLILDHHLLTMESEYHGNVTDGSQWVFLLIQGDAEKRIYFNNHFPEAIQDFAVAFDRLFFDSQFAATNWEPVLDESEVDTDQGLWD